MKPRLLDLFCGAGGAAMGYHRAGFEVVGIDVEPQPHYPFEFYQADALAMRQDIVSACWHEGAGGVIPGRLNVCLGRFDAIHASPVCKLWSQVTRTAKVPEGTHTDQIAPLRPVLEKSGLPYVIENVPGAPLRAPVMLCGSMFDLDVKRHRLFETNWGMPDHHWPCRHQIWGRRYAPNRSDRKKNPNALARVISVAGGGTGGHGGRVDDWRRAMGTEWMVREEIAQAIPPAYTEWVGQHLMAAVRVGATA